MSGTNEAFSRVKIKIDAQLKDQRWDVLNRNAVRFEYVLPDKTKADYVLCDRHGRALAVIEAKRAAINPAEAEAQGRPAPSSSRCPMFSSPTARKSASGNGSAKPSHAPSKALFSQSDLERRAATGLVRRDPLAVAIDKHIVERDYQTECIDTLCREINSGRRKMLVEMATGTGKTRTAAAFIKRLFEANAITRALSLSFSSIASRRRFQDEKRITITTLQSMVTIYHG